MAKLTESFKALALKLQEMAGDLSNSDVCRWLYDALRDTPGGYCCYVDHIGDGSSGDVIYSCDGDMKRAPYEITTVNGKVTATIDTDNAFDVLPHTTYEPEADEADHYASMESAKLYQPGTARLAERFVSKAERDSADSGSFAGKGKSFPILKPADVMAAVRSMGRAGSDNYDTGTLKRNIIRIAKKKGFTKSLPQAWQDGSDDSKESDIRHRQGEAAQEGSINLVESAAFGEQIRLAESTSRTDYPVKLIAPGRGSSAYYPKEVLQRDGPKVFKAGTHMYWNHATDAEDSARPEGDLNHLAGVLTSDAFYDEAGKQGAGLYARAKVFSDYAKQVEEKAPHIGLSIRASGTAEKGKLIEGRPVLKEFLAAESTDFVTRAGAGGMVLTESARAESQQEHDDMTDEDRRLLRETQADLKKLREREALRDVCASGGPIAAYFESVRVSPAIIRRVVSRLMERWTETGLPMKEGKRDDDAIKKLVEAETREEVAFIESISPTGRVQGLGPAPELDPAKAAKQFEEAFDSEMKDLAGLFCGEGKQNKATRKAFREGRAA